MELIEPTRLYRYESIITDEIVDDNFGHINEVKLILESYNIVSYTPCGYWIASPCYHPKDKWKWVSKQTHKRFAYETPERALEAFYYRKRRQIDILTWQLTHAKAAMVKAKGLMTAS